MLIEAGLQNEISYKWTVDKQRDFKTVVPQPD